MVEGDKFMIAYQIKQNSQINREFFCLIPPLEGRYDYVVTSYSSVTNPPATVVMPANSVGEITEFYELSVIQDFSPKHLDCIKNLGYKIQEENSLIRSRFHD